MYSIERIDSSNLKHLVTLYKNAFGIRTSIEFLRKKYETEAFGASYIGYLAIAENGDPAAYYGVFPMVCDYDGKKILCAQSGDTMTHNEHRGKGLFIDLAQRTYKLAEDSGVKFIFGFPNQQSYPGFVKKLNWAHKEDLNLYSVKVTTVPLAKLAKKVSFFKVLYVPYLKLIYTFIKNAKHGFPNSLAFDKKPCILHDEAFFNYKSYFNSTIAIVNAKSVWFKIDGRLWIGDIEHCDHQSFNVILKKLRKIAFWAGVSEIQFHTSPHTIYDTYMEKIGKIKQKNPVGYLDLGSGLDISLVKYQSGDFDTF